MLHLRITVPTELTGSVLALFEDDDAVSQLAVLEGVSRRPVGDIVLVDVAREAADNFIERLEALGIPECGTIHVEKVSTWVSRAGSGVRTAHPRRERRRRRLGGRDTTGLRGD